jgi:hypothetical protein
MLRSPLLWLSPRSSNAIVMAREREREREREQEIESEREGGREGGRESMGKAKAGGHEIRGGGGGGGGEDEGEYENRRGVKIRGCNLH